MSKASLRTFYNEIIDKGLRFSPMALRILLYALKQCEAAEDNKASITLYKLSCVAGCVSATARIAMFRLIDAGLIKREYKVMYSLSVNYVPMKYAVPDCFSDHEKRKLFYKAINNIISYSVPLTTPVSRKIIKCFRHLSKQVRQNVINKLEIEEQKIFEGTQ